MERGHEMKKIITGSSLLLGQLLAALPAFAHEGSTGEHLVLGMDTGLAIGLAVGFFSGVAATLFCIRWRNY